MNPELTQGERAAPHNELPPAPAPELLPQPSPIAQLTSARIFGAGLLAISIVSGLALTSAYVIPAPQPVETHAAAAEVATQPDAYEGIIVQAKSAYVYDISTGTTLFDKNGSLQLPLASITKVPLILAVSEVLAPEDIVTISRDAVQKGGGGLTWGEEWKVRDLTDYTLLASSNTGAEALAEAADSALRTKYPDAPLGRAAVWRMNNLARELDLTETYFLNPSGLDESATQAGALGSARDVADLFAYAIRTRRDIFEGTTRDRMYFTPINYIGSEAHNTNAALDAIPNLVIGKTGYTDLAGGNLAIVFEPEPDHLVAIVVLGSTYDGRFDDIKRLINATENAVSTPH